MFGFFKNLLRRPAPVAGAASPRVQKSAFTSTATHATVAARPNLVAAQPAKGVPVPLQPILDALPVELQSLIVQHSVGDLAVAIPLEKVLAQLSRGVVKVSFGELRQWAPHVFDNRNDRDRVLVSLPLNEILPRISPALIQRRRAQKQVQVPMEISSPFDQQGQSLVYTAKHNDAPVAIPEPPPVPAPVIPQRSKSPVAPPVPEAPAPIPFNLDGSVHTAGVPAHRSFITSASTPPPPAGPVFSTPAPAPARPAPAAVEPDPVTPEPPVPAPAPIPLTAAQPAVDATHVHGNGHSNGNGHETLLVSLASIAGEWPEQVRREIVEQKLADAEVALPMEALDQALKKGRILFRWKSLRSWMRPAPAQPTSPNDQLPLDIPLRLVAPIFLEHQKTKQNNQQKISIDEDIPNLFFGFPQPEIPGAAHGGQPGFSPGAKPVDTNYYIWDDGAEMVRFDESAVRKAPTAETRFARKYATPNEIVSRAAGLENVAGVVIALPDGLMVASKLPADVNGDTLAAFLPQIYGKVSACTRELRTGELNNLSFTVGNVPWKVFRVNAIFFAAFGRPGQSLPTGQLAALAGELDHKPK